MHGDTNPHVRAHAPKHETTPPPSPLPPTLLTPSPQHETEKADLAKQSEAALLEQQKRLEAEALEKVTTYYGTHAYGVYRLAMGSFSLLNLNVLTALPLRYSMERSCYRLFCNVVGRSPA